ncbi:CvpA family protein [uncultured Sphaerochaeta sp.]|uniref:CvpA family protein n=1 Tax=uncultured Sphaerochaeta sp. TaxID=886478 RepID=UPI002A0A7F94|nr:CvpA family protein [uncultured Sphaerochaeta sp.]
MDWGITIGSVYFNSIDVIVFAFAIIGGIGGALNGFADSFSHRAGYLAGFLVGLMFTRILADLLVESFNLPIFVATLISFILLFLVGYEVLRFIGNLVETALTGIGLTPLNSLLGFVWGVFEMLVLMSFILYILQLQKAFDLSQILDKSQFVLRFVRPLVPATVNWITTQVSSANV